MPKFFLNYGGPDNDFTSSPERMAALDKACQREYTGAVRSVTSMVKGVQLTVHTYGIHRALTCEIPNDATPAVRARYDLALYTAERVILRPYNLTSHNCVTSVATILNGLDPNLTSANVVAPWTLDANLKKYCGDYEENSTAALFINEYQKTVRQERFSLLRIRNWTDERIESATDIIKHSYGRGKEGSGERTRSTLMKLGWVTEDKNGVLIPFFNAPADFRDGLNTYNEDFAKVQHLKSLYKKEASVFSFNKNHFFDDNPDYQTALTRLQAQERRHPHGASAKVLKIIAAEAVVNLPHEELSQGERESTAKAPLKEELHSAKDDSPSLSI